MIPELGFTAKTAQLDHREGKIKMVVLCLLHNRFVQLKGRQVLGGMGGDQPAVVADRDKYANFHHKPLLLCVG